MPEDRTSASHPGIELVLEHLKEARAFDFTGYKRTTLARRIDKRMAQLDITDHEAYVDHLQVHPEEFEPLLNTILINVTSFFRDPDAWDAVRDVAIPELLVRKPQGPIRVWSAGCSTGQEAYSAVMLLAEAMGVEAVKERVKVYATDVDDEALEHARVATYGESELECLPDGLADRYFETSTGGLTVATDLRRAVIFGRHDLLQDAPISRVDLLICRNTLMYFNADAQSRLVHRLHYSLADGGFLLLGKAEMLLGQSELFDPVDAKRRLFRKLTSTTLRSRLLAMAGAGAGADGDLTPGDGRRRLLDAAFEHGAQAQLVLDADGTLVAVNASARATFNIPHEMVGRPFQDLEISYRPVELRSAIDEARSKGTPVLVAGIARWTPGGDLSYLDATVAPLGADGRHLGMAFTFVDVTRHRRLQDELEHTHRDLEVAYEELQSANEELETTNEELQATIEELETTNEELQSTNEELETMNEELSSTNEELHTINDELRQRTGELDQVNAYLESVLTGLHASVIVVDTDERIRVWNGRSFEMWGLRSEEVEGRVLTSLDIGFPLDAIADSLHAVLAGRDGSAPVEAEALSRRGTPIHCTARVSPLTGAAKAVEGAIVIIEAGHPTGSGAGAR